HVARPAKKVFRRRQIQRMRGDFDAMARMREQRAQSPRFESRKSVAPHRLTFQLRQQIPAQTLERCGCQEILDDDATIALEHCHDVAGDRVARKFAKARHRFLLRYQRYHALRFDSRRAMTMKAARLAAVATANSA